MANNQNRNNRTATKKKIVAGTEVKAPATTVDPAKTTEPEVAKAEESPEAKLAIQDETVITKDEPIIPATAKIVDKNSGDGVIPREDSTILTENLKALSFKLEMMDERMGKGKVFDPSQGAAMQKDLVEHIVNFISKVPPTEVRKAIGGILDAFNHSDFITPSCLFKGIKDPVSKKLAIPEWWLDIGTLLSLTADPSKRFKVVGKEFTFDKVDSKIPAVVITRLKEFYQS